MIGRLASASEDRPRTDPYAIILRTYPDVDAQSEMRDIVAEVRVNRAEGAGPELHDLLNEVIEDRRRLDADG